MFDVVIVGAGISGISAACHLRQECPDKTYAILEARDNIGGTWDLFRYPGIRSDSDMHTFGFNFKPWTNPIALADGPSILSYLDEAIEEYQVGENIHFGHKVLSAAWDSTTSTWMVKATDGSGKECQFEARVLFMCSGYYNYEGGYRPHFDGEESYKGVIVHPQDWPGDLDYAGKKIAVIGSGATAVTLVPAMSDTAEKVTMIQRSPTYIVSRPGKDKLANLLTRLLPDKLAYKITRWRNIRFQDYVYSRARKEPEKLKNQILKLARKQLGDDYDIDKHLTPSYDPWTQRLCLIPDADLFEAIKKGKAEIVTDQIECFTESGIVLKSGTSIDADIIVTATGLRLQIFGGVDLYKDREKVDVSKHFSYQGMMLSDIPNLVQTFGYINASWTLRADLNSKFVCDMLKRMDATGATQCVPEMRESDRDMPASDWVSDFNPGYMQRGLSQFPRQSDHMPWRNTQNYLQDRKILRAGPADDGVLQFH